MKAADLREMSDQELEQRLKDFKAELFNLRFQQATGQLQNPIMLRDTRHNIARVKTILRERDALAKA